MFMKWTDHTKFNVVWLAEECGKDIGPHVENEMETCVR